MPALDRSIFRERAIEKYMQRQEMHVVLRLVSPRVFGFLWMLFLLFFAAVALAWSIQTPVVVSGQGIVIQQDANRVQQTVVLLLLPADQLPNFQVGQSVNITINAMSVNFNSTIQNVETTVMSPNDIRNQFKVPAALSQVMNGPSTVAVANVEPPSASAAYLGSECQVQVQVGSESSLTLLPGFSDFVNMLNNIWKTASSLPIFSGFLSKINKL